jgi:hypothetical protein
MNRNDDRWINRSNDRPTYPIARIVPAYDSERGIRSVVRARRSAEERRNEEAANETAIKQR